LPRCIKILFQPRHRILNLHFSYLFQHDIAEMAKKFLTASITLFLILSLSCSNASATSFLSRNVLRLEQELLVFHGCSVHVILNHINFPYGPTLDGSYRFEEFQITPIILSLNRYNIHFSQSSTFFRVIKAIECDGQTVRAASDQEFKFRAPPNPRAACLVQVYIDPVPCKRWVFSFWSLII